MCKKKDSMRIKTLLSVSILLLSSYIFEYFNNKASFNGILFKDGKIIEHNNSIDENTQFFIGSLSKQITAYLVVKYVDNIDLYVTDILSENNIEEIKRTSKLFSNDITISILDGVQIKHLLSNSSGIDFSNNIRFAEPGQVFKYDNCNYIIAGKILEQITKKSFLTLCTKFFEELDLKNTFLMSDSMYKDLYNSCPNLMASMKLSFQSDIQIEGKWTGISFCGGVVSSPNDLYKIIKFLYSKENIENFLQYTVPTNMREISYGFGFYINKYSGLIFHDCVLPISTFYYVGYFIYSLIDERIELKFENVYKNVEKNILYMYNKKRLYKAIEKF